MAEPTQTMALSAMEEKDLLLRIQQWHRESRDGSGKWREEARENYDFVAGEQWDEKDKANLKKLLRPALSFNRIAPIVDAVSGMEVNNRQEVRYIPRTEGDEQVNEVLTGAAQWVRDECDAEDEESDAFIDLIVCGMGWTETRIEYETDPDGIVRVERVDPFEMYWDRSAKRRNLDGARYICRVKEISLTDARAMFPGQPDESLHAAWTTPATAEAGNPINREEARYYADGSKIDNTQMGRVRIVEAQWWELKPFWRAMDPTTGQLVEVPEERYKELKKLAPQVQAVKQQKRVYYRAFVGSVVLNPDDLEAPCKNGFSYQCMTGKRDRNKSDWYGLVRAMKDPQKYANKLMSAILHLIATSGKGVVVETDGPDDVRRFEEDWAHPDAPVWMKPGALANGKIQPKVANPLPPGLPDMMMQSIQAVRDVAGVNLEFIAAADNAQSGVLEYQRKQAAMTTLASLFDSLRRYRKEQGRVLLYFIQKYLTDGRLVRIVGQEKSQYVPLTKDEQVTKYDVIVDQAPTSPNQKEATWAILGQLMPTMMKMNLPPEIWVEIVKNSPLPSSFAQKLNDALKRQAQQPPPEDPKITQMKMQTQLDQQKQQADLAFKERDAQLEQGKAAAQLQMEREKNAAAIMMQREKNQNDIELAWAKANADIAIKQHMAQQNAAIAMSQAAQQAEITADQADQANTIMAQKAKNDMKIKSQQAKQRGSNA